MKSEWDWIRAVKKLCGHSSRVRRGIGDDAAVLQWTSDKDLLITADMILEGRHFKKSDPAYRIGWKAMAVNLSDIAAMGGIPTSAVVSLGVPPKAKTAYLKQIYRGILASASSFGVRVVGGDTNASKTYVIALTLLGEVERGKAILRSGARPGDQIFVSGTLGGSYRSGKHLSFMPRIPEARYLARSFRVSAMMDLSDGLSSDIFRMCEESGVGAVLDGRLIPRSSRSISLEKALSDGEDFELLFTLRPREAARLVRAGNKKGMAPFTRVGEIVRKDRGVRILLKSGRLEKLRSKGYDHFTASPR